MIIFTALNQSLNTAHSKMRMNVGRKCKKHQPFGWVIGKSSHRHWAIESTGSNLTYSDNHVLIERGWITLERVFEKFTFADGTPFGKLEE